jgi:hypothetical protein
MSLPQILADRKPVRRPLLTLEQIRAWAESHERVTGSWPDKADGPVAGAPGELWVDIDKALYRGNRGLPGGTTLAKMRGGPSKQTRRPTSKLTVEQILAWVDAHHDVTGDWPGEYSGPIPGAPGERWAEISRALRDGGRGLPAGLALKAFIAQHRNPAPGPATWNRPRRRLKPRKANPS